MKGFNKLISSFFICCFVLALVPGEGFNYTAKADTSTSKILNYNEGYGNSGVVAKGKALFRINKGMYDYGTYYFSNGEKEQLANTIFTVYDENRVIISANVDNKQGNSAIFDVMKGVTTESYDKHELDNLLENKYNKKNMQIYRLAVAGNKKGMWYIYEIHEGNLKSPGVLTPDKKIVDMGDSEFISTYTISDDKFYGIVYKNTDDESKINEALKIIDTDGIIKEFDIDEDVSRYYVISNLKVSKNKIYVHLKSNLRYNYADKNVNGYYELVEKDGKLYKGEPLLKDTSVSLANDSQGYIWYVKDGNIYKFEDDQWVKKFQADRRMNEIQVYDDNNFLVSAQQNVEISRDDTKNEITYYITGIHTLILDGKCLTMDKEGSSEPDVSGSPNIPTNPTNGSGQDNGTPNNGVNNNNTGNPGSEGNLGSNTNPPSSGNTNSSLGTTAGQNVPLPTQNNGTTTPCQSSGTIEKVVINTVKNDVLPVSVNTLDKDKSNLIEVTNKTNAKKLEVTIEDAKAIKEGNGALQIKVGQESLINLPFSAVDKNLISDKSKLVLSTTVEENSDIVKGLKAIKKLYSFDLTVVDGNKKTAVHKFANGSAEITLTLSDEELKELDKNNLAVFYYNEDTKKFEIMETKVDGNKITFNTPHFSKFVIAERSTGSTGSSNGTSVLPKTGSSIGSHSIILMGALFILLGAVTLYARRDSKVRNVSSK